MAEQPGSELESSSRVDTELVRAAQEGSASAARLIVRRHNQRLYRVARAIVRDDTEAEDVLQEAYLSAFRSLTSFRADASLSTWLTRIVANKAIGRLKRGEMAIPLDALDKIDWVQAEVVGMPHFDLDPERTAQPSSRVAGTGDRQPTHVFSGRARVALGRTAQRQGSCVIVGDS
jgi:RNA polymerase sigma-70 factor (ECF subfamily)